MKSLYVNKFIEFETFNRADIYTKVMDTIFVPYLNRFNNFSLVNTLDGTFGKEYIFQINNSESLYMAFVGAFNEDWDLKRNSDWAIWSYPVDSPSPEYRVMPSFNPVRNSTAGVTRGPVQQKGQKIGFEFYSITDENNNLIAYWEENAIGSYINRNPYVFVTTTTGKKGILFGASGGILFVYLNDPNNTIYYICNDQTKYTNDNLVIKENYIPIFKTNSVYGEITDIIDSKFIHIFNTKLRSYNENELMNTLFSHKLIKVDNKLYRQINNNWWYEDSLGDEEPFIVNDDPDS